MASTRASFLVLAFLLSVSTGGCSSGEATEDTPREPDPAGDGSVDARPDAPASETEPDAATAPDSSTDSAPVPDAAADTTTPDTSTDAGAACPSAKTKSVCGTAAIVRVHVALGAGVPSASGKLVLRLNHYRLGSGSSGGVGHTEKVLPAATLAPGGAIDAEFDMCSGGAMWSEENCEFNLVGFVDTNGNGALDPGEPAGRAVVEVSCRAEGPPCFALTLGCTSGAGCASFADPGACKCAPVGCTTPASRIKTCS